MGALLSRAARTSSARTVHVSEQAIKQAVSPQELQRQLEIKEALQHVRIEKNKNERLVSDMSKLISSVETRKYEIYSNPEVDRLYSRKRKTKQEREATERGRLSTASLKSLYDDRIRASQQGRELPLEKLAQRYGADHGLLKAMLQYNCAPVVRQEEDGRLVGSWPKP